MASTVERIVRSNGRLLTVCCLILLSAAHPATVGAQLPDLSSGLSISLTPEQPGPGEEVTISLEHYGTDLARAVVEWSLDNTLRKRGIGERLFRFTAAPLGETSVVTVKMLTPDGGRIEKTLRIRPGIVLLIPEAETTIPPLYRGRPLPTYQSAVNVVTLPFLFAENGTRLPASSLLYTWRVNDTVVETASGFGKNTYRFVGRVPFRPANVSVLVSSLDRKTAAGQSISIAPQTPRVLIYENHPLLGLLLNRALTGEVPILEEEARVTAVPYFFSRADVSSLRFHWTLNYDRLVTDENTVVFRKPAVLSGSSLVSVAIENVVHQFQTAGTGFSFQFGEVSRSSLLGL